MLSKLDRENLKIKAEIFYESLIDQLECFKNCGRKPAVLVIMLVLFMALRTFQKGVGMTYSKLSGRNSSMYGNVGSRNAVGLRGGYAAAAAGGGSGSSYGRTQWVQPLASGQQQQQQFGQNAPNTQYGQNLQYGQQNAQYNQQNTQYGARMGGGNTNQFGNTMTMQYSNNQQQQQQQQFGQTNSFGQSSQMMNQHQQIQQPMQYGQSNYNNGQVIGQYNTAGQTSQYGQNNAQYNGQVIGRYNAGGGGAIMNGGGQYNAQMTQYGRPR